MTKKTSRFSGDTKNVLIAEVSLFGHSGVYLSWIVKEAKKYSVNITLLLPDTDIERERYDKLPKTLKTAKVYWKGINISSSNLVLRQIHCWRWLKKESAEIQLIEKIDFIFVPTLDAISYAVAILGSPFGNNKWFGLVIRPHFHHPESGVKTEIIKYKWARRFLFLRLLENRTLTKCLTIDETLTEHMVSIDVNTSRKLIYMPDPTSLSYDDVYQYKRKGYEVNNDQFVILIFGGITLRKGVNSLVKAVADKRVLNHVKILLAGQQSNEIVEYLTTDEAVFLRKNGRLEEWNWYLSQDEEIAAYFRADIVWAGYRRHSQMSGVIVTAGMLGKPVIATEQGLIGMLTKKYHSGLTVDVDEQEAVVESINKLSSDNELYADLSLNSRNSYACYSTENAGKILWKTIIGI